MRASRRLRRERLTVTTLLALPDRAGRDSFWLALILILYLLLGGLYAVRTPDWQNPDEPAHYNYIAQVAVGGCCPVIAAGDWDQEYLDLIKQERFAPETLGALDRIEYEDHQPPLYYLMAAPVYSLTNGSLNALRLFSVLIGAAVIMCAYGIGRTLLPDQPQIALGAAALTAFVPQHAAVLASVNNDGLAELIVAMSLLGLILYLKEVPVRVWMLGLLAGIGALTKASTLFLFGLIPLMLLLDAWFKRRQRAPLRLIRLLAAFFVPALAVAALWWLRNLYVYGWPDFLGLGAHDSVVIGQLRTADLIAEVGLGETLRRALETTFNSFWGQFGWMAAPLPAWAYTLIAGLLGVVIAGWLVDLLVLRRRAPTVRPFWRSLAWLAIGLTLLLGLLQYLYYNTEFVQFQGRYLYPALIPFALWLVQGLDAWRRLAVPGQRWGRVLMVALPALVLLAINIFALWRILPSLAS